MIPLEEALRIVLGETPSLETVDTPLAEAQGAWLQEAVASDVDLPPADVSAMDGFALRAEDAAAAPVELRIVGTIPAGVAPEIEVTPGTAAAIMTGAPLPRGADAVQKVEHTERNGDSVRVLEGVAAGTHVRRRGENLECGQEVLAAGSALGAVEIGLLAGAGRVTARVARHPEVAVIPTGDELVEPGTVPGPGQIRNTNGPGLLAQVAGERGLPLYQGIARDDAEHLDSLIARGLRRDVLLLAGGVSMGLYDLVTGALQRAGVRVLFEKVRVKPGKPTVFGVAERDGRRTLVFGLPGNPVSAMVIFRLLVAPALRRMQGDPEPGHAWIPARLCGTVPRTRGRTCLHPARARPGERGLEVTPRAHHGSGDLVAWRGANALIRTEPDQGAEDGALVPVLLDPARR